MLPQPSQAATLPASLSPYLSPLPTTPPQSLSPPPATPPRFLSPPPATPRVLSPSPAATTPSLSPFYDPLTQLPSQYSGKANEFHWNDNGREAFHFFGTPGVKNISDIPNCPLSILLPTN